MIEIKVLIKFNKAPGSLYIKITPESKNPTPFSAVSK